jgi:hypothetical protein
MRTFVVAAAILFALAALPSSGSAQPTECNYCDAPAYWWQQWCCTTIVQDEACSSGCQQIACPWCGWEQEEQEIAMALSADQPTILAPGTRWHGVSVDWLHLLAEREGAAFVMERACTRERLAWADHEVAAPGYQ